MLKELFFISLAKASLINSGKWLRQWYPSTGSSGGKGHLLLCSVSYPGEPSSPSGGNHGLLAIF